MKPIVIAGAGIGGLSTAIYLAAAGEEVLIIEKNRQVGGKMNQVRAEGFTWDTGPSVITMPHVLEDLFTSAGRQLEDYVTLDAVEPLTRYFYPDGTVIDASRDPAKMAAQISQLDPGDVEGYSQFLAYAARLHRITGPVFIYDRPPTWRSFLRVPVADWFKADGLRTMDQAIRSHVHSPHLRQLLGRFATYVGASPYEAPATLNVIAHVELAGGVYYPQGGVYQIATAFERLAEELGVTIQTGCEIKEIDIKAGQAIGVRLADGQRVPAKAVISNVDVTTTYDKLLPGFQSRAPRETSCSGFVLLLGIEKEHPDLAHHNIFFSSDYPAEFEAIFKRGQPAEDPTIYVAITSKKEAHHAPPGTENWFVLVNVPAVSEEYDWDLLANAYRDLVLDKLAQWGYELRDAIRVERVLTPIDLARGSGAWRGALYGASSNHRLAAFRRPHNRSQDIQGLYFVGGTTHPGGGVPMVTLSGKVTAELVLEDMAVTWEPSPPRQRWRS
ncbi:MAG: phytoene desaturase family protein [Chloroflexota bacterium]|jgi:phytoene desaturase